MTMIERISSYTIRLDRNFKPDTSKRDRNDVYEPFASETDIVSQELVIGYRCVSVGENPDFDW